MRKKKINGKKGIKEDQKNKERKDKKGIKWGQPPLKIPIIKEKVRSFLLSK